MGVDHGVLSAPDSVSIRVSRLYQGYRKQSVIRDLSIEFRPGITAILGPNGSGKTTLLRTLATDILPKAGALDYGSFRLDGRQSLRRVRRYVGFLPQDFRADPSFSIRDLVRYAAWLRESDPSDTSVTSALEAVGLTELAHRKIRSLSGGMKQRAAIAATIVGTPSILILDEPTVGLDPEQRVEFRRSLSTLGDRCVILSTHLIEDAAALADRVVVISDGSVAFDGTVDDIAALGGDAEQAGVSAAEAGYLSILNTQPAG